VSAGLARAYDGQTATGKRRRAGPPPPSLLLALPAPLATTWRLHILRNCAANSVQRERRMLSWLHRRRERAKASIGPSSVPQVMWTRSCLGRTGTADLKLELDPRERRTIGHCLLERRSRLIETTGDTTRTAASRRIGSRELELIESVLRKLRLFHHTHHQFRIDAD
jgi:hypothetical protein